MANTRSFFTFAILGASAIGWAVACSSSNDTGSSGSTGSTGTGTGSTGTGTGSTGSGTGSTGTGTGSTGTGTGSTGTGTGSTGSTGTGTGTTGTSGTSTGGVCATSAGQTSVPVVPASSPLITNQSVPSGQLQINLTGCQAQAGGFYTDVDGNESDATKASLMPPNGAFAYTTMQGPPVDGGASTIQAACISAQNVSSLYGTGGLGFNFASTIAGDAGGTTTPIAVDVSAFQGVQFWLYLPADGGAPPSNFQFKASDKASNPAGGECTGTSTMQCYDDPFQALTPTAGWNFIQVPFAGLGYGGFGNEDANKMYDSKNAYGLTWQVQDSTMPAADGGVVPGPVSFSFCVANVSFY